MKEACGVVGVWAEQPAAPTLFAGLVALQHRGQESAGIATSESPVFTGMGRVTEVFSSTGLSRLSGAAGIGHTRYSTAGASNLDNAQPFEQTSPCGRVALAHNGHIPDAERWRPHGLQGDSDSAVLLQLVLRTPDDLVASLRQLTLEVRGAYSLVVLGPDGVYAVRDPLGFRPLCLGTLPDGHAVASESAALTAMGARFLRELLPGEIVRLDAEGVSSWPHPRPPAPAFCLFEHVYFARPDSVLHDRSVGESRHAFGQQLALESPVSADVVVGIPATGLPSAAGFAAASGLPLVTALIEKPARTFIHPGDVARQAQVREKYTVNTSQIQGRRVVLVDDSLVRGHTARQVVQQLREAGATEVHLRIAAPSVQHPCFMGVDLGDPAEILAATRTPEQIRGHLGADSLRYLTLEGLTAALDAPRGHCTACFSGRYPEGSNG